MTDNFADEELKIMQQSWTESEAAEFVAALAKDELSRAMTLHGSMNSGHEGYAVILEELDELWHEVKKNPRKMMVDKQVERDRKMASEAVQIAAMAMRFVIDVILFGCDSEKEARQLLGMEQ